MGDPFVPNRSKGRPIRKVHSIETMDSDKIDESSGGAASNALRHIETTDSIFLPISRATFEKLYLNPKTPHKGQLHKTFGNPTPIALMGFLISTLPMSCIQMGWRGAGGNGGAIL